MNVLNKRLLFIFLFLCSTGSLLQAQSYYFRNYQVSNGVSSNTITCITQDRKGFMWFGTRNGLNRFDGTSFKIFRNNIHNSQSLGSNSILSLHEDNHQQLWVGTYKGVYIYDASHETFKSFKDIPQVEVRAIDEDKNNNIWLVAGFDVYRYNTSNKTVRIFNVSKTQTPTLSIDESGVIWIGTDSGIVRRYDPAKGTFDNYNLSMSNKRNEPVFIQTIYPASDTTILIATLKQVYLFNTKSLQLSNVFQQTVWADNIQVHKITRQSASEFWFGTENGLYILNLETGATLLIKKQYGNPYSIDDNVITDFCRDTEGGIWVGTFFGGINYYSKQLNRFQKYFPLPGVNSLSGNLVHEICADKQNNIWIGTEDAGLNKVNTKTGIITHFMPGKNPGNISYQNIHGLLADDNKLWIGTYEHGLDVMDLKNEKVIRHYEKSNKPNSLNSNFIVCIYKMKNNDILIGTWNGLYKYNKKGDNFMILPFFKRQAQAIHEDENGTLWVCSYGNGVYYYNSRTGVKGNFSHDPKNNNSLIDNYVNNLFEDRKKNIWFCTESGLCKYDAMSNRIIPFTSDPVLGDNQVFKILEDNKGILWISTSKGLVSLDPETQKTKLFNTNNGLLTEQFNYNSGYNNNKGILYFGTVKGMISFDPSSFTENEFVPPVFITGLQINNADPPIGNSESILKIALPYTTSITLPYDSSTINIEVAALSYSMPALNEYRYKMEGLDKDWILIPTNRKIYYTKLPPGNYIFKVKGSNGDNVWETKETDLSIHILPPFWASIWAYMLYVLLALSIAFVILRYYIIALREKNQRIIKTFEIEKEREIYNAKIEFFTNITHEIRTPLTLIKLPVEKLLKVFSKDATLYENLTMINKNTNRLIHLTDQLLDFRKAEANNYTLSFVKTDINEFLKELFATYTPAAEEKKLSFKLEMPRISLLAYVDAEAFRKILSNLFSNAIKYAESSVIVKLLPFNSDNNVFHIEFKNDGYLIPYEMKDKIFEPFYRLKQTEKQAGTGIGLPLSRSLAELHKGGLQLKRSIDQFNIFLLSIPIHQETEINLDDTDFAETKNSSTGNNGKAIQQEGQKVSILIVEDNKEIVKFLEGEMHNSFYIYTASEGQEALNILTVQNIDLVISDIMMPIMDGIELCRKIKTDIEFSHIPVILLTAKNTLISKIEGLETGADAYIEKPFVMEYLLAQITSLLNNRNIIKGYYAHSPLAHIKGIASTKADKTFLEELQKAIDENILDQDIDVDTLSKMMNMSRGTFYRKIKSLSDLTPNELINLSRLKKAAEFLAEGKYKINEVANLVGYNINSNFSRDFHKQFGMSPSEYLSNLKEKQIL